jgi:hypothetical protein
MKGGRHRLIPLQGMVNPTPCGGPPTRWDYKSADTAEDPPLPLSGVAHLLPRCTKQPTWTPH